MADLMQLSSALERAADFFHAEPEAVSADFVAACPTSGRATSYRVTRDSALPHGIDFWGRGNATTEQMEAAGLDPAAAAACFNCDRPATTTTEVLFETVAVCAACLGKLNAHTTMPNMHALEAN